MKPAFQIRLSVIIFLFACLNKERRAGRVGERVSSKDLGNGEGKLAVDNKLLVGSIEVILEC